jgi:hypothetical protein
MRNISRVNRIIELSCAEAYELGYKNGMTDGAKPHGKKYQNKIKKLLKKRYRPSAKS